MGFTQLWFDRRNAPAPFWARLTIALFAFGAFSLFCWALLAGTGRNWQVVEQYRAVFWRGWLLTVGLSLGALVLSTGIGLLAALARRSSFLPIRYMAVLYIEAVRGMPLLVLLLFAWYVVAHAIRFDHRLLVGVLALSLFSGAYIAEMIRAGIESVGETQQESARAIGLTPFQAYRFVIFPQTFRHTLPPLAGQFASLIKDSSLLSILGIAEFTFNAQQVNSATLSTLESYVPLAVGYLALTIPISLLSKYLEHKFHYES